MKQPLRFYVLVLPNLPWPQLVERFQRVEQLGFGRWAAAGPFGETLLEG